MAPAWDLLVRGGTLIDPARSIHAKRDVAFSGGRVAAGAETLTGEAPIPLPEILDAMRAGDIACRRPRSAPTCTPRPRDASSTTSAA
jgi:hypothetical protein